MISLNVPTVSCQANSLVGRRCSRVPCFQARLVASAPSRQVRRNAAACADHLGDVVHALTGWGRDHQLTAGQVPVLVLDPATAPAAAEAAKPRPAASPGGSGFTGFAFGIIP